MNIVNNIVMVEFDNFNQYSNFLPFMAKESVKINYKVLPDWYFCSKSNTAIFKIYNKTDNTIQIFVENFIKLDKGNK